MLICKLILRRENNINLVVGVKLTNDNIYYVNKLTTSSGGQNVASMEISGDGGTKKLYMDSANGYRPHFNNGTTDYTLLHNGDFVNLNNGMDYVIESWNSGTSWYRLYKSGWLEQGGQQVGNGTYGRMSVTLLRPYSTAEYSLSSYIQWGSMNDWYDTNFAVYSQAIMDIGGYPTYKTATSFQICSFSYHIWWASGYAA